MDKNAASTLWTHTATLQYIPPSSNHASFIFNAVMLKISTFHLLAKPAFTMNCVCFRSTGELLFVLVNHKKKHIYSDKESLSPIIITSWH